MAHRTERRGQRGVAFDRACGVSGRSVCARAPVEEAYTALCTEKGSRRRCLGSLWTVLAVCTGMLHDGLSAAAQRAVALHRSAVQGVCFGPCWWCAVAGAIVRG